MCTRFPEAIPLKDIHTSTVVEALLAIFSRVGLPNKIHSNRGSQFTSDIMREVYRLLNVKQSTTTPYHASSNGIVENFNKTMENLLKKVTAEKRKDWHRYLGPLMFAVRDTPQDSTVLKCIPIRITIRVPSAYTNDVIETIVDGRY